MYRVIITWCNNKKTVFETETATNIFTDYSNKRNVKTITVIKLKENK